MDTSTIAPIAGIPAVGNLQEVKPATNSGRERQPDPKRRKAKPNAKHSKEALYKVDGHVESDEHGVTVDVSA